LFAAHVVSAKWNLYRLWGKKSQAGLKEKDGGGLGFWLQPADRALLIAGVLSPASILQNVATVFGFANALHF